MSNKVLMIIDAFSAVCFVISGLIFLFAGRILLGIANLICSLIQSFNGFIQLKKFKKELEIINRFERFN